MQKAGQAMSLESTLERLRSLAPAPEALGPGAPLRSLADRWIVSRLETAVDLEALAAEVERYLDTGPDDPRLPAHLRARLEGRRAGGAPLAEWADRQAEGEAALLLEVAAALEDLREMLGLAPGEPVEVEVQTPSYSSHRVLEESAGFLLRLAGVRLRAVRSWMEEPPEGSVWRRVQDLDLYLLLPEGVDLEAVEGRLEGLAEAARREGDQDAGRLRLARVRALTEGVQACRAARGRT